MASTAVSSLQAAFDRLGHIADLPPDWDSYGAAPPSTAAVFSAWRLLHDIAQALSQHDFDGEPWTIGARADGGIMIEWRGSQAALEMHVEPDGSYGYLLEHHTRLPVHQVEADNVSLADLVQMLKRTLLS